MATNTRYTDGKDQAGNILPEAQSGDFATVRNTGTLCQLQEGKWVPIVEPGKAADRRNPKSR